MLPKSENQETLRRSKEERSVSKWYTADREENVDDVSVMSHASSLLSLVNQSESNQNFGHRRPYRADVDSSILNQERPTSGTSWSPTRSNVTSIISTTSGDTINNDNLELDGEGKVSPPPIPEKTHVSSASDLTTNGYSSTKRKTSTSASKKPLPPLPPDDYPEVPPRRDSINNVESRTASLPTPPEVPARKRPPEILPRRSLNQREKSISSTSSEL